MNLYPIPADFINEKVTLSWCDIKWGYKNNLLTSEIPIKKAENSLLTEDYTNAELEPSFLIPSESDDIGPFLNELCSETNEDSMIREKWLYILLSWLWINRESFEDPLDEVESIYTDFDYPAEIESFIKYIPPTDGYDPSLYSYAENINRLMKNWEIYLQKGADIFK
ncbi:MULTISPECIES: DUF2247 family protein [Acinetobacter calcoaceticus/baumannii complex]|uniref:DUF2247 domain-containing protein n=1 Tax=Acinetobacter nosocomialis 28F TaxID=1147131 RepID=A0AA36KDA1_ACINO|nr:MULTISPECIES: DUF2247 family protein [Acinetobacter calcoaceticus/baumannii complex]KCX90116.1 hypothetical protein J568_3377 [Acinetobacter baumannii 6112]EXF01723.1 hypothetical protein J594_0064 [Acinetobacter sp. 259052]KRJ12527.1 hypothetical protein APC77_05250 [Acinetobacter nosocomialis]OTL00471.1 hypothetical protein B9X83_13785 [Acinetobacter nosocomialis]OUR07382.1 hypothetical protein B4R78_10800 [Acinetobacter nosocomialis]